MNPDFEHEEKGYGWTGSFTDVAGPANNKCMEAYEKKNFDIYQVVKGAPKGVYEISFNGFFRNGPNADAYAEYQALKEEGKTVAPQAWIYVNNNMTPMKNCYDEEMLKKFARLPRKFLAREGDNAGIFRGSSRDIPAIGTSVKHKHTGRSQNNSKARP